MSRQGLPAPVTPERGELCFYAVAGAPPPGCLQRFSVDIVMSGRRATPKRRRVCEVCSAWLLQERLANVAPPCVMVPPPDNALVSVPCLHSRWLCFASRLCFAKDPLSNLGCEQTTHGCDGQGSAKRPKFIHQQVADYTDGRVHNDWIGLRELWHTSRHGSRRARYQRDRPGLGYQGIFSNKLEKTGVFVKAADVASGSLPHVSIALYMVSGRGLCPRCFAADSVDSLPTVSELVE